MPQVNEFSINLPMVGVTAVGQTCDVTASTSLPADVNPAVCDHISVFVDSTQITNYNPTDPAVTIDMVLSVSVQNPSTGECSSYKMVKRLSMDKCKLACEAEGLTPQVIESADTDLDQILAEYQAAKRAREIAGIAESAGNKTAKLLISYDDKETDSEGNKQPPARATSTLLIKSVKDRAHALHIFDIRHKSKYKNAKVVRVTMQD